MGGYITIARRKPDGTVQSYQGWTNPVPDWVRDTKMFTDPEAHLDAWFQALEERAAPGDNCYYVDHGGEVYPTEYGIVFIDQISKQIFDCQEYTNLGNGLLSSIMHDGDGGYTEELMSFVRAKRFRGIKSDSGFFSCETIFGTPNPTEEQVKEFITSLRDGNRDILSWIGAVIVLDFQPDWKINSFPVWGGEGDDWMRHPQGMIDLRARIDEIGIEVNGPKWDAYMRERYGNYYEREES